MDLTPLVRHIENTPGGNAVLEELLPFLQDSYFQQIKHGDFPRWRQRLERLPQINTDFIRPGDTVSIGKSSDCDEATLDLLRELLKEFIPWRKGPFELFGIEIDTEWRSNLKWDRLQGGIAPLGQRKVLDVGCGNGYYGFRMLEADAELVLGIDPHIAYVAQFWLLKHFAPALPIYVLPLSLEQLPSPLNYFDTAFSMGVVYHRRSPIDHLLQLKNCLRPGGELVVESIYVDGPEGYCLTPEKKYARMSNVWFVPSIKTLMQWLSRCGFTDIEVIDESTTTLDEQRKTPWMPYESLTDALDSSNMALTIEGLPAPKRVVITASRQ